MIKLVREGKYKLTQTPKHAKVLALDKNMYAWVAAVGIGEILVASDKAHSTNQTLAVGRYRMYKVQSEPKLTSIMHLELLVGDCKWQGYLLPTGLPSNGTKKGRIISTKELITKCIC